MIHLRQALDSSGTLQGKGEVLKVSWHVSEICQGELHVNALPRVTGTGGSLSFSEAAVEF